MATITFDTLAYVEKLKSAGVPEEQAKVQAKTLADALGEFADLKISDLATRQELKEFRLEVEGDFKLLKWMLGFVLAGVVSLILKGFFV
ncbi:MAG: DUF1640 domain-containing protein [Thermodesulfobacteriota bacterium]